MKLSHFYIGRAIVFVLLLFVLAVGYVFFRDTSIKAPNETGNVLEPLVPSAGLTCNDSPKYFAVEKSLSDSVGSNILIKYKASTGQKFSCAYLVSEGDFELKNVMAEYFLAFTDNFLVLDSGTAPEPRGLIVYDLRSREKVFTDSYAKPVIVKGDTLEYWAKSDQKPTAENCPTLAENTKNYLGSVIMSKVSLDLSTLTKKDTGAFKCLATQ